MWTYVPTGNQNGIGWGWVFQTKINPNGSTRVKAHRVIRGYEQVERTDYGETFAPFMKLVYFHLLLVIGARNAWFINHMDVVTVFLNLSVEKDINMNVLEGIELLEPWFSTENSLICKLKKSLYGPKQALLGTTILTHCFKH